MITIRNNSLKIYKRISILLFIIISLISFYNLKSLNSTNIYNFKVIFLLSQLLLFIIFIFYIISSEKLFNQKSLEFDSLANIIPGGIAKIYGNDKFTIHYADNTFYKIIGYNKDEFLKDHNNNSKFLIHPDDLNTVIRNFKFQLDNGQPFKAEFRIIKKNSKIIWISARGNTLSLNKNISLYNFIFTDITTSKNALSQLELENKRYEIICKLSDNIYFEYDIEKDTLINSNVCKKLFGNDNIISNFKENLITSDVIYRDDIPIFIKLYDDFNKGMDNLSYKLRIKNFDGNYKYWNIQAAPIFNKKHIPIKIIGKATLINTQ